MPYEAHGELEVRADDLEIADVGRQTKMPWELDGPRWHLRDRVGRRAEPCRWDARILERVIERIHELGRFSDTNWNARSVVEIAGTTKSHGWFFHAITGEAWLLKMKFRTTKGTFRREQIVQQLGLKPLNEMPDLPIYGNEPRVRCKTLRGPWQEIEVRAHSWDEIDTPAFWQFLEQAVRGFQQFVERASVHPAEIMPWKSLGPVWHTSRRGFPLGKPAQWDAALLEQLCRMLHKAAGPDSQFQWHQQQVVHLTLHQREQPWATLLTKRPASLELHLQGPKNQFGLGRITQLGFEPELMTEGEDVDVVKLKFRSAADLRQGDLLTFLQQHLAAVQCPTP